MYVYIYTHQASGSATSYNQFLLWGFRVMLDIGYEPEGLRVEGSGLEFSVVGLGWGSGLEVQGFLLQVWIFSVQWSGGA